MISDLLHKIWRKSWLRYKDQKLENKLSLHSLIQHERTTWAEYVALCKEQNKNVQIGEWKKLYYSN